MVMPLRVVTRVQGGRVRIAEPYDGLGGTEIEVIVDGDDFTDEGRAFLHAESAMRLP
jgi:hypothetical protein